MSVLVEIHVDTRFFGEREDFFTQMLTRTVRALVLGRAVRCDLELETSVFIDISSHFRKQGVYVVGSVFPFHIPVHSF